jgi:hypothetical protein
MRKEAQIVKKQKAEQLLALFGIFVFQDQHFNNAGETAIKT